jgi:NADPH:quinone reductase
MADVAIGAGGFRERYEHLFPVTLGRDFAGVVEAVGSRITAYAIGDEVFGFVPTSTDQVVHAGSFADYVAVPETSAVAIKPADVDALGAAGVTATNLVAVSDPLLIERLGELARACAIAPRIERLPA